MNTSTSALRKLRNLLIVSAVVLVVFSLTSCKDEEVPIIPEFEGYATDEMEATYTLGSSPCPMEIAPLKIDVEGADNAPDSVSIKKPTGALTSFFANNQTYTEIGSSGKTQANVRFTCTVGQTFTHTYTVHFYKNGTEVKTEDVQVKVTVKQ